LQTVADEFGSRFLFRDPRAAAGAARVARARGRVRSNRRDRPPTSHPSRFASAPPLPLLSPLVSVVPSRLFAWAVLRAKRLDSDRPTGLSKVTFAR